jgi:hypothetical protein
LIGSVRRTWASNGKTLHGLVGPEKVGCLSRFSRLNFISQTQESPCDRGKKFAILFATTILSARKLIDMDPNKPNMAKGYFVDRAIDDAALILERIDRSGQRLRTKSLRARRTQPGERAFLTGPTLLEMSDNPT